MVRTYKRQSGRQQWSKTAMEAAIDSVRRSGTSIKRAAKDHGIPRPTLIRYLKTAEVLGQEVITLNEISRLFDLAFMKTSNAALGVNGFRKAGIFPLNRFIFNDNDFAPADVTDVLPADPETDRSKNELGDEALESNAADTEAGPSRMHNEVGDINDSLSNEKENIVPKGIVKVDANNMLTPKATLAPLDSNVPAGLSVRSIFKVSAAEILPLPKTVTRKVGGGRKREKAQNITSSPSRNELKSSQALKDIDQLKKVIKAETRHISNSDAETPKRKRERPQGKSNQTKTVLAQDTLCEYFKLTAVVLLSAGVLAAKEAQPKSSSAPASASHKTPSKIPHGKREAPVGFGHMEYLPPSYSGYNYGVAQPSFNVPQYPGQKYFMAPFKYPSPQPASFFSPAAQHGYNSFADNSVKYSIGSKELSDLLKALNSPSPAISIKAVPTGHGWDTPYNYDSFSQYKPTMFKVHEAPTHTYGTPQGPPLNSYYSHGYGAPQQSAPAYAAGIKGLGHYASSINAAIPDLYSGNKYISSIKPLAVQNQAHVLSPLHTSIHNQKPFKPSTYLGSTNDSPDYSHTQAPTSTSVHNSYLAPSLQYLPSKAQNKVIYEQPSKTYLPSLPSSPSRAYLPPKPSHTYLPAGSSSQNYIPVSSHGDSTQHLQHLHHQHSSGESKESYEYSGSASAPTESTIKSHNHPWQP
ncbi:uncharacterized protein LOC135697059 [Ochlerotatus camptorhynchus]|uniref:uncharacterized protein LOC135697059 n=1 Tax=Ochlerotatus camptorhynchus TaxID=644619 RepID=UPI0031E24C84